MPYYSILADNRAAGTASAEIHYFLKLASLERERGSDFCRQGIHKAASCTKLLMIYMTCRCFSPRTKSCFSPRRVLWYDDGYHFIRAFKLQYFMSPPYFFSHAFTGGLLRWRSYGTSTMRFSEVSRETMHTIDYFTLFAQEQFHLITRCDTCWATSLISLASPLWYFRFLREWA